ncbi:MAG TPA: hypothetical protein GXZ59_08390 [Clostridiaceae bacterium]|nr:hypothetical protein [Clostridiaceae bacterium]
MGRYANLIGWLITLSLFLTLLNYPIKAVYRKWVSKMDKETSFRKGYLKVQQFLIKNHRWFAISATVFLIAHLILQIQYRWFSRTGALAAGLLILNIFLGAYGHYIRKKKKSAWLYLHRIVAVLVIAAIVLHIVSGGR